MGDVREVPLTTLDLRLSTLRLSDPKSLARLRKSVQKDGVRHPVVASDGIEEGVLVVVDGFKRIRLIKESGELEIAVRVVTVNAVTAHAAMLSCNRPEKGLSDLEEAWVVQSLHRQHRLAQVRIAELLSRHKSWVCRRLKLVEQLEKEIQEDIRLGLLSTSVARELCRLPRGNQFEVADTIRDQGLTVRQAGRLVSAILDSSDPEARREVLADPLKYLAVDHSAEHKIPVDPRLSEHGNYLRECLLTVDSKLHRLTLACRTCAPAGVAADEAAVLVPLIDESIVKIRRGLETLEQLRQESEGREDERRAEATGLRHPPPSPARGVGAWHRPGRKDRPEDGEANSEAGGEAA